MDFPYKSFLRPENHRKPLWKKKTYIYIYVELRHLGWLNSQVNGKITGWWCNNHLQKYEFVNGKDDIPYIVEHRFRVSNNQPVVSGESVQNWSFFVAMCSQSLSIHHGQRPAAPVLGRRRELRFFATTALFHRAEWLIASSHLPGRVHYVSNVSHRKCHQWDSKRIPMAEWRISQLTSL